MKSSGCYLCGSYNYRLIIKKSKYGIVKCKNCDFVYTTPIPSQEEIDEFYRGFDYKDSLSAEKIIRSDAKKSLRGISKYVKKSKYLLDVGCGRGYFLDEARKLGWDTYGIDVSESVVDYAKNELHLNVAYGDIFSFQSERKFDVVILNQVIEHFVDPKKLIATCRKYLEDEGLLYIATPNIESLSAKVLKGDFDHYIPPEHVSYFSQYTLKNLLDTLGFRVLHVGSWSYPADLGGIVKALLGKMTQTEHAENFDTVYESSSRTLSGFRIKQAKSFLFDQIFCRLFFKVLSLDSWGINLEVLALKL